MKKTHTHLGKPVLIGTIYICTVVTVWGAASANLIQCSVCVCLCVRETVTSFYLFYVFCSFFITFYLAEGGEFLDTPPSVFINFFLLYLQMTTVNTRWWNVSKWEHLVWLVNKDVKHAWLGCLFFNWFCCFVQCFCGLICKRCLVGLPELVSSQAAAKSTQIYSKICFLLCVSWVKMKLGAIGVVENWESAALKCSSLRWTHNIWSVIQKDVVDCEMRKKARRKSCNQSANNCCAARWRVRGGLLCCFCHHHCRCQFGLLSKDCRHLDMHWKQGEDGSGGGRWNNSNDFLVWSTFNLKTFPLWLLTKAWTWRVGGPSVEL